MIIHHPDGSEPVQKGPGIEMVKTEIISKYYDQKFQILNCAKLITNTSSYKEE